MKTLLQEIQQDLKTYSSNLLNLSKQVTHKNNRVHCIMLLETLIDDLNKTLLHLGLRK